MTDPTTYQPQPQNHLSDDIYKTSINGLYYISHRVHPDDRGFYSEIARIPEIDQITKLPFIICQINQSHSIANSIRGFHSESWRKLITVISGSAYSVLVDIRPDSQTFLQKESFWLGHSDHSLKGSLFIDSGIANSFCVVESEVDYLYSVDQMYKDRDKSGDRAVSLFDTDIAATWPLNKTSMIISDRDKNAVPLRQLYPEKF